MPRTKLANPTPSSPQRPPIEHLYFRVHDPESNEVLFVTHAFSALYAVHYWLNELLDTPAQTKWHDDNTILFRQDNYTLTVKGTNLQDAIEHTLTKEEKQWTPSQPDSSTIRKLKAFYSSPVSKPQPSLETKPKPSPKPQPAPKRHKTQKPAPNGMITVAQIAEELNIQPNKARQVLRKAGITKPEHGWSYKIGSKDEKKVRKVLSAS